MPKVFISYNHNDKAWKDRIVTQLRVLETDANLEVWEDGQIPAGNTWLPDIQSAIRRCDVAILLISADFLTSSFIREHEVPELRKRREGEELSIIPVIVKPCAWLRIPWLSALQAFPEGGVPLSSLTRNKADTAMAALATMVAGLRTKPVVAMHSDATTGVFVWISVSPLLHAARFLRQENVELLHEKPARWLVNLWRFAMFVSDAEAKGITLQPGQALPSEYSDVCLYHVRGERLLDEGVSLKEQDVRASDVLVLLRGDSEVVQMLMALIQQTHDYPRAIGVTIPPHIASLTYAELAGQRA